MVLSTRRGMHRFTWELRFDPIGEEPRAASGTGAVPHHTYPTVEAPWAPPGEYTVRLGVGGKTYTQPLSLRLDPRVQTAAADLARLATLSREMYDGAVAAHTAWEEARALVARLDAAGGASAVALKERVEALAPAPRPRTFGFFRGGAPSGPSTLNGASDALMSAAMAMQEADVAPTARQIAACDQARAQYRDVMAQWSALQASARDALDAEDSAAGPRAVRPR
jgi:hypothetical protein